MSIQELLVVLNSGRLSKLRINELVNQLEHRPDLVKPLLDEVFRQDKEGEFNASWVFDHLMRKQLAFLVPHIDYFMNGIAKLTTESCMRPMAHTCELLTEAYFRKRQPQFTTIAVDDLEPLVSVCFDWLIGNHKVATKVFAMTSLFYLGFHFTWIHPQLKPVLEDTIAKGTAGYKNRGQKLLATLKNME